MTKTNFTAAQAIAHVKRQFITSDINFEWLNRNQIKELIEQREIFDQNNAKRSIKSVEDSVGLVKSHNLVAYVRGEIYLIDVVRTIGITSNGNIEESALQRALKKYYDLKNETNRRITKKFLIFTNSQMLTEFENYISLSADKKEELEKHLIRTGVIYFPLFQNDTNEENGISSSCDNEELNCEQIIEQMKTGFVHFDKLSDDIKTEISYILERTNKIIGGELESRKFKDRKDNQRRRR